MDDAKRRRVAYNDPSHDASRALAHHVHVVCGFASVLHMRFGTRETVTVRV